MGESAASLERETAELAKQQEIIKLVAVVIQMAVLMWFLIPEWRRRKLAMHLLRKAGSLAGESAARLGRSAMGAELSTGRAEYTLPYLASLARERCAALYEKARGELCLSAVPRMPVISAR